MKSMILSGFKLCDYIWELTELQIYFLTELDTTRKQFEPGLVFSEEMSIEDFDKFATKLVSGK